MAIEITANGESVTAQGPTLILREAAPEAPMAVKTYTIGAAGFYTTWAAAVADWNAGTLASASAGDNIVFQEIDGAAYVENVDIGEPATAYASLTLTAEESVRHNGVPGIGARLTPTSGIYVAQFTATTAWHFTVEWLELDGSGVSNLIRDIIKSNGAVSNRNITIANCVLHGAGSTIQTTAINISRGNIRILNNVIYDITPNAGSTQVLYGIFAPVAVLGDTISVLNNTIYNITQLGASTGETIGIKVLNNANTLIKNNVVTDVSGNGTVADYGTLSSTTASNNASEDGSHPGTSGQTVTSSVWNDAASNDFQLASGSTLFEAGADLGTTNGVNVDITGRDRDAQNDTWSIGAWQVAVGAGGPTNSVAPRGFSLGLGLSL